MVVAEKWIGTQADRHDMEKLQVEQVLRVRESHRLKQTLPLTIALQRNFGKLTMFGFASTLTCTWEILLA
jgi:hypothetical protein